MSLSASGVHKPLPRVSHCKAVNKQKNITLPDSVENIMNRWVLQMGFPVVTINTTTGTLTQKHFLLDPGAEVTRSSQFKAGYIPTTLALNTTKYLSKDTEYMPWESAIDNLGYFSLMFDRTEVNGPMQTYLRKQVTPLFDYFENITANWTEVPSGHTDQYLKYTLDPEKIRKMDSIPTINYISRNVVGQSLVWDFIQAYSTTICSGSSPMDSLLEGVTQRFSTELELKQRKPGHVGRLTRSSTRYTVPSEYSAAVRLHCVSRATPSRLHTVLQCGSTASAELHGPVCVQCCSASYTVPSAYSAAVRLHCVSRATPSRLCTVLQCKLHHPVSVQYCSAAPLRQQSYTVPSLYSTAVRLQCISRATPSRLCTVLQCKLHHPVSVQCCSAVPLCQQSYTVPSLYSTAVRLH
ncbi:UNVERIFIED_CONTAM: hypothetical protein FKN15_020663 [Acipenser sinensis]